MTYVASFAFSSAVRVLYTLCASIRPSSQFVPCEVLSPLMTLLIAAAFVLLVPLKSRFVEPAPPKEAIPISMMSGFNVVFCARRLSTIPPSSVSA